MELIVEQQHHFFHLVGVTGWRDLTLLLMHIKFYNKIYVDQSLLIS